ncbi:energy-coupling factor transporter transmembrane component T [Paenibacillus sp.]|jgi:energy-coupling factor transport system permease protein|uniref:energy-coupling factor transporter transmembrane component T family protein n=1 Tax=Paenibacillus sp. TaxID=58172 RepID=UPI0028370375|nr:energy-coupling factor transporter transmembrane component T [Paenibacillus sp.]MDR0268548.1 energy-coupling factor transporter transmembrane protein EcfT [Paenibacillus sp.]
MIAYHQGKSQLHRTDPLSKLVLLFCIALLTMRLHSSLGQALLLGIVALMARWGAGMSWEKQAKALALLAGFAVPFFLVTLLTVPGEQVLTEWGLLRFTLEAFDTAGSVTLRMFTVFLSSYVFMFTTDPRDMVLSLTVRLRVPYRFAFGLSMALTFLPLLQEEGKSISAAHQVRGQGKPDGLRGKLEWGRMFASAVVHNSLRRIQQTAGAMEAKGFGAYPDRTFLRTAMSMRKGRIIALVAVALTVWLWWYIQIVNL